MFDALDLAAEAGFRGVEIWGRAPHTPEEFSEDHTKQVRDRARANGLEISMFGSYVRPVLPDFPQRSEEALKIAKILGTKIVRIWAGNREPHEAGEDLWNHVAGVLHEFALRAEYDGISLAMEMHSGTLCATPEGALRVIEQTRSPNLKLNFQVIDPAAPDLDRVIGMVGEHVVNVHAQNHRPSPIEEGRMELCWIEEGLVDYDHALALLAEHGFHGYVEAEFLKGESVSDAAIAESLQKDAGYLRALTEKHSRRAD